jgi:4-amino-4-deoxy-L-arabinose transferase-like glycosyltransferase
MRQSKTSLYSLCAIGAGSLLVTFALFVSSGAYEQALLGQVSGALTWGPAAFRVLLAGHGLALVIVGLVSWKKTTVKPTVDPITSDSSLPVNRKVWLALSLLSVLALILRLWNLNSDLWYDELISLLDYFRPPMGEIVTSFASQNQHMLYSILAHACISLFGETAAAVRLPSVLFGVASLWALFLLGRQLIGVRESLLACALMTVSYHHIWFSQNARGYMGLLLFSTLATWLFLEALKHNTWRLWIGYAIAVSLGMWLHMTMAFVVAAHGLIYLSALVVQRTFRNTQAKNGVAVRLSWKPFVAWLLCISLSLQMHSLALPEFFATALHMPSLPSEWSSLWWVVIESLSSLQIGFSGILIVLCGMALMAVGFLSILKSNPIAGLAMVLPALIGGTTMLVLDHYLWPRFFFFSMGFAILIAVRGAMTLPSLVLNASGSLNLISRVASYESRLSIGQQAGLALSCLMIAASVVTLPRLYALPKQDFSGARNWVEQSRSPGDAVVAVGLAGVAYGRYFAPNWSVAQSQTELDAVRSQRSMVWLVYILPPQLKAYRAEIWKTIQNDFETVEVFPGTLGGGAVYVCRQRTASHDKQVSIQHSRSTTINSLQ